MSKEISAKTSVTRNADVPARHFETGGPDFIWRRLTRFKEQERRRQATRFLFVKNSIYFEALNNFFDFMHDPRLGVIETADSFRLFWNALCIWNSYNTNFARWGIEACILAGADDDTVARFLGERESRYTVAAYRYMFFNIKANMASPIWMDNYIWEPARRRQWPLFFYDYILKMIAAQHGLDTLTTFMSQKALSEDVLTELHDYINTQKLKMALHITAAGAKLPLEYQIQIADQSSSEWARKAAEATNPAGGAFGDDFRYCCEAVGRAVGMYSGNEKLPKEEHLDHIIKHD